jgi:hypothetical protein
MVIYLLSIILSLLLCFLINFQFLTVEKGRCLYTVFYNPPKYVNLLQICYYLTKHLRVNCRIPKIPVDVVSLERLLCGGVN